jgi:3-hydroxybutyryl-CoA dehydratase
VDDTITSTVEVVSFDERRRRLTLRTACTNQRGEVVVEGEAVVLVDR